MRYLLTLGSNAPDAASQMGRAQRWLDSHFTVAASTGVYRSKALNGTSADYLNMIVEVDSELLAREITEMGKQFERECGRTPQSKTLGCVEMDVDLVRAGSVILRPVEYTRAYFLQGLPLLTAKV